MVDQELNAQNLVRVDIDQVIEHGAVQVSPRPYGVVFHLGNIDDEPVLTFSALFRADEVEHNEPNAAYIDHIRGGLVSAAGVGEQQAKAYVNARPGNKLGLTVPAHVTTNRGPEIGRLGARGSPTPRPSRRAGSDHDATSALPPRLAQIATVVPALGKLAQRCSTFKREWGPSSGTLK
ncbi:hypothetical protein GCM10023205_54200 [Yinghuangia aomiensis]|uniref:Uncharacterized protein n=1 Tax=Yinghuangia aomiensis TaxID=676205 RepID=A0ABP9HUL5_9ACTN